jgi:hypothetical protein
MRITVQLMLTLHLTLLAMHVSPLVSRQFTHIPGWDRDLPRCCLGCALPIVVRLVMPIRLTEPTTSSLILSSTSSAAMKPTTKLPLVGSLVSSSSKHIRLSKTAKVASVVAAVSGARTIALSRSVVALHLSAQYVGVGAGKWRQFCSVD